MDAESFTNLALRVLAGEATEGDRRSLNAEISADLARQEQFEQLKLAHQVFRTVAPMTEALRAQEPALPAHRVNELRTAVRQHFRPAANREKAEATSGGLMFVLRWIFAGGGVAVACAALAIVFFSNRSIEVGLYGTSLVRGDNSALIPADVPSAKIVTFDQDSPFDQWQNASLAWYQHAKIWVDNEHDQLHIIRRNAEGRAISETRPLWQGKTETETDDAQRKQIQEVVEQLKN